MKRSASLTCLSVLAVDPLTMVMGRIPNGIDCRPKSFGVINTTHGKRRRMPASAVATQVSVTKRPLSMIGYKKRAKF